MMIDHVWNKCPRRMVEARTHINGDSDHNIIWVKIKDKILDLREGLDDKRVWCTKFRVIGDAEIEEFQKTRNNCLNKKIFV